MAFHIKILIVLTAIFLLGSGFIVTGAGADLAVTPAHQVSSSATVTDQPYAWANTTAGEVRTQTENTTPPAEKPTHAWTFDLLAEDSERLTDPLIVGDTVVLGTEWSSSTEPHASLTAVNRTTGETRWSFGEDDEQKFGYDLTANEDTVVFGEGDSLYGVDLDTGEQVWRNEHTRFMGYGLAATDRTVYARLGRWNRIEAIDPNDGRVRWDTDISNLTGGAEGANAPVVTDESVHIVGGCSVPDEDRDRFCITTLDRDSGDVEWQWTSDSEESTGNLGDPVVVDGTLYVQLRKEYLRESATLVAFDLQNRSIEWRQSVDRNSPTVVHEETAFVTESDRISAVNRTDGSIRWRVDGTASLAAEDQLLATDGNELQSLSASSGSPQWNQTAADVDQLDSTLAVANGTVVALGGSTADEERGKAITFEGSTEPPEEIAVDPDTPAAGEPLTLDAGTIDGTDYRWDFTSNGTTDARGSTVDYRFERPGEYDVTLTVTTDGEDRRFNRSITVVEPISIDLDVDNKYPLPDESVDLSGAESSGEGTLSYEWREDGDRSQCEGQNCTVAFVDEPVNVTLQIRDEAGQIATESVLIEPVPLELNTSVDGTSTTSLRHKSTILQNETFAIEPDNRSIDGNVTVHNISVDGPVEATGNTPVEATATGTGRASVTVRYDVPSIDSPVARTTDITAVELRDADEQFEYTLEPNTRTSRVSLARLQSPHVRSDTRDVYRQIEQRTDGLPESIGFSAASSEDLETESGDDRAGYASPPNRIAVGVATDGNTYRFPTTQVIETTRHETVHVSQFAMDAETDGDWNFLIEGHAEFEDTTDSQTIEYKPAQKELLEWEFNRTKYNQAEVFVDAFIAEYGRQTFLELLRNSEGTDMRTEFEETTGESFDSFYDRWLSGGENDPAERRGDLPKLFFHYADGELRAETVSQTDANVSWDLDDDGTADAHGDRVEWTPPESGAYPITLMVDDGDTELNQTQVIHVDETTGGITAYAGEDGTIDSAGLAAALADWQAGELGTSQLEAAFDAWQRGEQVV